jgi:flagellar biosynthetic protein FliO
MPLGLLPLLEQAPGFDVTRYVLVCVGSIAVLLVAAWAFQRFLAERLRARAAKRSLRIVDVLPLSSKQRLVVVRCYDRTFLLGLGDKEVRSIAELDTAEEGVPEANNSSSPARPAREPRPFSAALASELAGPGAARGSAGEGGLLA